LSQTHVSSPRRARPEAEAGFSLIEALIAALLLLFIVIGVLLLFSRAMMNNIQGNDASNISNAAVEGFEELLALPFDNQTLTLPAGVTQTTTTEVYSLLHNEWILPADLTAGDEAQYTRTVQLEQFQLSDLTDDGRLDTPLPGGSLTTFVQLKRLEIQIQNERLVGAPPFTVQTLHVF
jgi:hypothetical protein